MDYETLLLERDGDVGIVTLNRPDRMNAIDNVMAYEIGEAVHELNEDAEIGAIVLTGAGRAFSAGADFSRFEDAISATEAGEEGIRRPRFNWIDQVRASKPTVCAVNGYCIGAGMTRTLPCDVRIASTGAVFSMRFVKIGIVPEIASTQILPQIVGLQRAADLTLSGRDVTAEEALEMGLILDVVDPDRLLVEAVRLAGTYAENAPGALVEIKKLLYANAVEQDVDLVVRREIEALNGRWGTPENREAVTAFREKRRPDFRKLRSSVR